jgi:hypothetical protein
MAVLSALIAPAVAYYFDAVRISARQPPGRITLVYVGAEDCPPCRSWERSTEQAFRASPLYRRLTYRVVKSAQLFSILSDENWPEDLRPLRKELSPQAGVPLWLVVADGRVLTQAFGETQWRDTVLPKVRSLLD